MKNFLKIQFLFIISINLNKILTTTSFIKNNLNDGDELAEYILNELNPNEHEVIESDVFDKYDFTLDDKKNCPEIKKFGRQRKFCEKKLSTNDRKEIVDCIKTFCGICCEGEDDCHKNCKESHSMFPDHDPEEMLLSVCSLKNITESFVSVCDSLLEDKQSEEYAECFSNMCIDCCQNELGISDWEDIKMKKCLMGCKKRIEFKSKKFTNISKKKAKNEKNQKILAAEKILKESNATNSNGKTIPELSPLMRKEQNFRICGKLVLTRFKSMIKNFGELVYTKCTSNYSEYNFKNSTECLDNLCHDCCNILEEEMKIQNCAFDCKKKNSKEKNSTNENKLIDSNEEKQNKPGNFKSHVGNENKEIIRNINDFDLIKSICNTKYFKECHETLCNDYCRQSINILDPGCLKHCNDHMKESSLSNQIFEHIIKLHGQFKVKYENEKESRIETNYRFKENQNEISSKSLQNGLDETIERSKTKIKMLKEQLLEEEKNLLNIYKIKNK